MVRQEKGACIAGIAWALGRASASGCGEAVLAMIRGGGGGGVGTVGSILLYALGAGYGYGSGGGGGNVAGWNIATGGSSSTSLLHKTRRSFSFISREGWTRSTLPAERHRYAHHYNPADLK